MDRQNLERERQNSNDVVYGMQQGLLGENDRRGYDFRSGEYKGAKSGHAGCVVLFGPRARPRGKANIFTPSSHIHVNDAVRKNNESTYVLYPRAEPAIGMLPLQSRQVMTYEVHLETGRWHSQLYLKACASSPH